MVKIPESMNSKPFGCDILPITSSNKNLYDRTQEVS